MDQATIEKLLSDTVRALQELSGREHVAITARTRPVLDVPGFDSLNGVEATIEVLGQLGLETDFNNIFVEEDKALSISQAAKRLVKSVQSNK